MKRNIFYIFLFLSVVILQCSEKPEEEIPTKIIEISGDLSFGTVDIGAVLTRTLIIKNIGTTTVNINRITCPSDFSTDWDKGSIIQGGQKELTVNFTPTEAKSYTGEISISSDDGLSPKIIQVSGIGKESKPVLVITPSNLSFEDVFIGESKTLTFTISNVGNKSIHIRNISFPDGAFQTKMEYFDIYNGMPPNSSLNASVEFTPLSAVSYSDQIKIETTEGDAIITLIGNGVKAFTVSSTKMAFENINLYTADKQAFNLTNVSNSPLMVKEIFSDNNGFQPLFSENTIAVGESMPVTVIFRPTESKMYTGFIKINTNSGKDSVQITGTSIDNLNIYISGYEEDMSANLVPTYWRNSMPVKLPMSGTQALPRSITLYGSNVYITGKQNNITGDLEGMYWYNSNGTRLNSGNTYNYGEAYSIAVKKTDVYISGYLASLGGLCVNAVYWKNGSPIYLTNECHKSQVAYGIAISDYNDIYACGKVENAAVYWINGNLRYLTDGNRKAEALKIVLNGGDVYIVGYEENSSGIMVAKYWKNGSSHDLTDGKRNAKAVAIFIENNNVHVVGSETNASNIATAQYWKNGKSVPLQLGVKKSQAFGVTVVDQNVFVAGYENNTTNFQFPTAKYWYNGIPINLVNEKEGAGWATDIVVLKK